MKEEFDLEYQYRRYLQRVKLSESQMHPIQRAETKQAFMAACGQMLFLFSDELAALPEDEAMRVLENMKNQVGHYFLNKN